LLALADFMSGWLWRILLVAGFGGFYQWLALADFISGHPTKNGRDVLDSSA
jgi:hypothetical protein